MEWRDAIPLICNIDLHRPGIRVLAAWYLSVIRELLSLNGWLKSYPWLGLGLLILNPSLVVWGLLQQEGAYLANFTLLVVGT